MKRKRVTLEDVAQIAGVSHMTVSRVVNNREGVSAETRRQVHEAINELGYRPSRIARSLVMDKTFTIGLLVPDITNPFFAEVVRGIEDVAWQSDYHVLLANSNENPARERVMFGQMEEAAVDGVVICSSRLPDDELFALIKRQRAATVINRYAPPELASAVLIDPESGNRNVRAAHHLLRTGRKHIGYLYLQRSAISSVIEDFTQVMEQEGAAINPSWYRGSKPTWEAGYEAATALLTEHPELDAIVGGNDLVALAALRVALELGRCVPDDLALTGGDDILMAREVRPALTTFRSPKYEVGAAAARLLLAQLAGNMQYEHVYYREEFIVRESAPN
ncbi:MAG: LacI family DNA-binding transcriptional regulator [Anaerolineae bacterium]|nr:LacI family DNA-binding transcriptional regulator [Anaerolineae bacterium]